MASQYDLPYTGPQVEALLAKISELESEMPSKTSDLTNDSGFITSSDVPTKTSDLNNDSGFITNAPVAAEAARAQAAEALLATISSLQAEITRATGVEGTLQDLIDGIAAKIPSTATDQNQLADKAFVNSSIATATAEFRGTYNSLAELQAVSADENDYGYVRTTDAAGNTVFKRYKYASGSWVFEYDLNNSSFTASQWAAINSAITAELVEKLRALPTNAALTAALAAKQDVIEDLSSIRSKANSAYQKPSGGIPKTDLSQGVQDALDNAEGALTQNDIADNLTTDDPTKALSAEQGKVLKNLIEMQAPQVENKILYFGDNVDGYIQDGLVFHLDGIDKGQNSGEWTDLVGGVRFTNNDCVFRTNHVEFPSDSWGWLSTSTGLKFSAATHTIEIVFDGDLSGSNKFLFFGNVGNSIIVAYYLSTNVFLMSASTARSTFTRRTMSGPIRLSVNNFFGVDNMAEMVNAGDGYFGDVTGTAYIGRRSTSNETQKYVGKIYSIRIYNRQLSRLEMLKNQQYDAIRFNL